MPLGSTISISCAARTATGAWGHFARILASESINSEDQKFLPSLFIGSGIAGGRFRLELGCGGIRDGFSIRRFVIADDAQLVF
jgi:hypothetical protein